MKIKVFACSLIASAAVFGAFAQENSGPVFQEGFEGAKVNSKGKLTVGAWYAPGKLKEYQEVSIIRDKLNVKSGKFACKYSNMNEKLPIYMLHETGVIKLDDNNRKLQVSVNARGTGSFLISFVFYADGKFLRSVGGSPVAGKQGFPTKKNPFTDADWTTCYGEVANIPAGAKSCKVAIFVNPKSEIFLDDMEISLVPKQ